MNAMQLEHIGQIQENPLRNVQAPVPEPGPGEIRVKVRVCGVCRTDLHVIEGDLEPAKLPIIPGHQIVGTVDAIGPDCDRLRQGDRVGLAWLRHVCGQCEWCTSDRENLCPNQRFTGYHADGGYAEYALCDEDFAYAIPERVDDVSAAPLLCAGIVGYRALKRCEPREGGSLSIYGFGSSAHIIMQIAVDRGLRVHVVSRTPSHQEMARRMGAAWAGDDPEQMPEPTDSAILFAPVGKLAPPALKQLKRGGVLSIAGIHLSDIPSMNYKDTIFYERDIHTVTANTREEGRELLRAAARIPVKPRTRTWPLAEANEALQAMKAGEIDGTGVLIVDEGD